MQSIQDLKREVRGPGHVPRRTNTKYVSEAFSFLDDEKYGGDEDQDLSPGYRGVQGSRSEPLLSKVGVRSNRESIPNGVVKTNSEFTIITSVEKSPVKTGKDGLSQRENTRSSVPVGPDVKESNTNGEFTIVTYAEEKEDDPLEKAVEPQFKFNSVYIVEEENTNGTEETKNDKAAVNANLNSGESRAEDTDKNGTQRNSVIVEGEVVELRTSPRENLDRRSRQATWKKNQAVVSEAFGFLKDIDGLEDAGLVQYEIDINTADEKVENTKTENQRNQIKPGEKLLPDSENLDVHRVTNGVSSESMSGENDEVGELVGKKIRQRRKQKPSSNSDTADDDGDSSDDDKGVYRESFRKSTWLYVGDNEELKEGNSTDYVPLADLGMDSCEGDNVFGDGPPPTPKIPTSGHRRNDSTATTASEADFKARNKFNSVSRRCVKRADSQQEYKRFTVRAFDQVKAFHIQKEEGQGYGIHLLDSKPAIVSGVDAGSPAEAAGVKEGQVVTSINGQNVVEMPHDDIIQLVQQNLTELHLEVGSGDMSHIVDLQQPMMTGYLQKQTSSTIFRSWKKRFFILRRDNCLYYYKTNQETDPLGAMPLSGYTISKYGDSNKFGFKAEKYGCRTFYFLAENRDDMTSWVGALNEAAKRGHEKKDTWMDVTTDNVGLPALEIRSPDCSGYLFKQARAMKRWRKRYCVLKDACIYYYKMRNSKQAEGVAHLHGYSVDASGLPGKKFSFCLKPPEKQMRVFSFYTDNDTDKERWVNALHSSIGKWVRVES